MEPHKRVSGNYGGKLEAQLLLSEQRQLLILQVTLSVTIIY